MSVYIAVCFILGNKNLFITAALAAVLYGGRQAKTLSFC